MQRKKNAQFEYCRAVVEWIKRRTAVLLQPNGQVVCSQTDCEYFSSAEYIFWMVCLCCYMAYTHPAFSHVITNSIHFYGIAFATSFCRYSFFPMSPFGITVVFPLIQFNSCKSRVRVYNLKFDVIRLFDFGVTIYQFCYKFCVYI